MWEMEYRLIPCHEIQLQHKKADAALEIKLEGKIINTNTFRLMAQLKMCTMPLADFPQALVEL